MAYVTSTLSVTDNVTISSITCTLSITAPNEGLGIDPTLLDVWLQADYGSGNIIQVKLHSGGSSTGSSSLTSITYETGRAAIDSLNVFGNYNATATWSLVVFNYSNSATGTINSWNIDITYNAPSPSNIPHPPTAPAARGLEVVTYGEGVNLRRNVPIKFSFEEGSKSMFLVPITGTVEDFIITQFNTNLAFSLHRISSGSLTDTTLYSQILSGSATSQYITNQFPIEEKSVDKGDLLLLSIDSDTTSGNGVNPKLFTGQCILRKS